MTRDATAVPDDVTSAEDAISLRRVLSVIRQEDGSFSVPPAPEDQIQLFGGQVASQCLMAAGQTVDPSQVPHSLHLYFTRRGRGEETMTIEVDETRDGRSFAMRHVRAMQGGSAILEMMASFHILEDAQAHQFLPPPQVTPPEELQSIGLQWSTTTPFEIRPVDLEKASSGPGSLHPFWVRLSEPVAPDRLTRASVLTYLSDFALMGVAAERRKPLDPRGAGSLDHALWFHGEYDPAEWLLYVAEPISNTHHRGFARGSFFTRNGELVASVAQEALLRTL